MAINKQYGRQVFVGDIQSAKGVVRRQAWTAPDAADDDAIAQDNASSNTVVTTITTIDAQPDFPRNVTVTPGGTTGSVPADDVVVTGTNIRGEVITENITLTEDGSALVAGSKAFKTVTSVVLPIQDGTGATYDVGYGDKLGLDRCMSEAAVLDAFADGVRETTAPAVAFHATNVESNTVDTNTATNGTKDFSVLFVSTELTTKSGSTA